MKTARLVNCSLSALRLVMNSVARCGRGVSGHAQKKRAAQHKAHVLFGVRTLHGVRESEAARSTEVETVVAEEG